MSVVPTFVWVKDKQEVLADERQFAELEALGFAPKLDSKKQPVPGPTPEELEAQLAKAAKS